MREKKEVIAVNRSNQRSLNAQKITLAVEDVMRKIIWVMVFVVAMISLQIGSVNNVAAKGVVACSPAGVWDYLDGNMAMIVPLDPTGKMFAVTVDVATETQYNYKLQGILEKIGPNLYAYTLYRYIVDSDGEILRRVALVGETEMIDCDTRSTLSRIRIEFPDGSVTGWSPGTVGEVYRVKLVQPE